MNVGWGTTKDPTTTWRCRTWSRTRRQREEVEVEGERGRRGGRNDTEEVGEKRSRQNHDKRDAGGGKRRGYGEKTN